MVSTSFWKLCARIGAAVSEADFRFKARLPVLINARRFGAWIVPLDRRLGYLIIGVRSRCGRIFAIQIVGKPACGADLLLSGRARAIFLSRATIYRRSSRRSSEGAIPQRDTRNVAKVASLPNRWCWSLANDTDFEMAPAGCYYHTAYSDRARRSWRTRPRLSRCICIRGVPTGIGCRSELYKLVIQIFRIW